MNIYTTCLHLSEWEKTERGIKNFTKVEYYSKDTKDVIDYKHCEGTIFFFPQNIIVQMEYDIGEAPLRYENIKAYAKNGEHDKWKEIKVSCSGCNSNGGVSPNEAVEAFFKMTGINPYENKTITF